LKDKTSISLLFLFFWVSLKSQVFVDIKDLNGIVSDDFLTSKYAKCFKSTPKIYNITSSGRTTEGECISLRTLRIEYKREKTTIVFQDLKMDTISRYVFSNIIIAGSESPLSSKNGIRVGDKVKLMDLRNDIDDYILQHKSRNYKEIETIKTQNFTYWFNVVNVLDANKETIVKIKRIDISTFN
jgi:hypothetical protein